MTRVEAAAIFAEFLAEKREKTILAEKYTCRLKCFVTERWYIGKISVLRWLDVDKNLSKRV